MQIVFNTKVKLSQPYFNCNLGNHSVASFCSEECHACLVVSLSSALYGCMYNSIFLDAFICLHVRLKKWDLDYDSMLQLLNISRLLVCRTFLTMYNIVSGHMYFPSSIFVQSNLPYQFNCTSTFNFTHTTCHSFAPCSTILE